MNKEPIRTEADYEAALADIDSLMQAESGSSDGERLDALVALVESYERQHFPMD